MMIAADPYYTPAWLADALADALPQRCQSVIDLAVGRGALLDAVATAQPGALLSGVDRDPDAVRFLRKARPEWVLGKADSLQPRSLSASKPMRAVGGFDAAIINPPFSYRGGRRVVARTPMACDVAVTPATAFVATALSVVRDGGAVCAIVPWNLPNIRGDADVWARWQSLFEVSWLLELANTTFPGARTRSRLVRITKRSGTAMDGAKVAPGTPGAPLYGLSGCLCIEVVRGRLPVHRLKEIRQDDGVPFVHSTNLRNGAVSTSHDKVLAHLGSTGIDLLLPRVGRLTDDKIALAPAGQLALSDCVIGIRALKPETARHVEAVLSRDFDGLRGQYLGSCAPYITIDALALWLRGHGFQVSHRAADAAAGPCECRSGAAGDISPLAKTEDLPMTSFFVRDA